jgi:hypothetical protein
VANTVALAEPVWYVPVAVVVEIYPVVVATSLNESLSAHEYGAACAVAARTAEMAPVAPVAPTDVVVLPVEHQSETLELWIGYIKSLFSVKFMSPLAASAKSGKAIAPPRIARTPPIIIDFFIRN